MTLDARQNFDYYIGFLCKTEISFNFVMIKNNTCINAEYTFLAEMLQILPRQGAHEPAT